MRSSPETMKHTGIPSAQQWGRGFQGTVPARLVAIQRNKDVPHSPHCQRQEDHSTLNGQSNNITWITRKTLFIIFYLEVLFVLFLVVLGSEPRVL